MDQSQEATLNRLRAYIRFSVVLFYLSRALERCSTESAAIFDSQLKDLEQSLDLAALFDRETFGSNVAASAVLASWFPQKSPADPGHFLEVWRNWFLGRSATRRTVRNAPLPPTLHQIQPFTANPAPHNMIERFEGFLLEPDKERRLGREPSAHTPNLSNWDRYAVELVRTNGGWAAFSRRTRSGTLVDVWPSESPPAKMMTVLDEKSFARRVRALASNRYLQVIVPSVAVAWPLWLLELLFSHQGVGDDASKPCVQRLRDAQRHFGEQSHLLDLTNFGEQNDSFYLELRLRPGLLASAPFPFGVADDALQYIEPHWREGEGSMMWKLEWFDQLRKLLFDGEAAGHWSPPLLLCHRGDIDRGESTRYIEATDPCRTFASVFASGISAAEVTVTALKGSWGAYACSNMELGVSTRVGTAAEFLRWTSNAEERAKSNFFLGSFPFDLFLRESSTPLSRSQIYGLRMLPAGAAEELDYTLPKMAFFGGKSLATQPKMLPLLTQFGRLLLSCRKFIDSCSEGVTHGDVLAVVRAPADVRATLVAALAARLRHPTERTTWGPKKPESMLRALLVQLGRDMGARMCPEDLRGRFDQLMGEWGWVHLLELTYYSNLAYGHELVAKEE